MIRFIVRTGIALAANAVGLLVAAAVLDGVQLDAGGFIVAVIVFTVAYALMLPFLASQLRRRNSSAIGGVALIAALVGLVVTDVVTDGLHSAREAGRARDQRAGSVGRRDGPGLGGRPPRRLHPALPWPEEISGRAPGLTVAQRRVARPAAAGSALRADSFRFE